MNFCPECESFLYLFIDKDNNNKLSHKCKSCGYTGKIEGDSQNYVYTNNIDTDSLDATYNILNNKFIIKDPTLPRLNNIICINPKCLTQQSNNSLVVFNISNFDIDKFIGWLNEKYKNISETDESITYTLRPIGEKEMCDYGEFHSGNIYFDYSDIKDKVTLIKFNVDIESLSDTFIEPNCLFNQQLTQFIKNKEDDIPEIHIIKKKMVFIKYDSKNMKYMYICSTCGTSWKNIT